jgi:hypothetical protein
MTTKPVAKGQAAPRLSPRWRRAAFILLGLVTLLLLLSLIASVVAGPAIRSLVASKASERGIPLRLGGISVRPWGDVVIADVCLSDPSMTPAADWVCMGKVAAAPRWLSLFSGRPSLRSLSLSQVVVSAGAEHGAPKEQADRLKGLLRSKKAKEPAAPSDAPKRAPDDLIIRLDDLVIDLANQNLPTDRIEVDSGRFSGTPEAFEAYAEVRFRVGPATLAALPAKVELPEAYELRISRSIEEPGPRILARGNSPVIVSTDKIGGLSASFEGIGGVWPTTLIAEGGKVGRPGAEPLLRFDSGLLVLSELTRDLEQLYMTSARVDGLNLQVTRDELGFGPLGALLGLNAPSAAAPAAAAAPAPKTPKKRASPGLWAKRQWYEKLPQQIELPGLQVSYHDRRADQKATPIALEFDALSYALRTKQIDLTFASRFTADGQSAGTAALTAAWNHADSKLDLKLDAIDVGVGQLLSGLVGNDDGPHEGVANLNIDYRSEDKGPGITFAGKASLRDLKLSHKGLRAPLELRDLSYDWKAVRGGADKKSLRWEKGDGSFNGIPFSFKLALGKFNLSKWPLTDRIDLTAAVPEVDAMRLFGAIPPSLRAELEGTRMAGTWGFDLDVAVGVKETDKGVRVSIEEPRTFEIHDDSLALTSLPDPVDVRRLNRDFRFTFTGAAGSVTRELYMRAPGGWMYGQPDADAPDAPDLPGDIPDGSASNGWVAFQEMNYYLVATQLYRENGAFFQKESGINMTELRRVIEEAINRRKLGRGASTIGMQLVKNVFLSHERAVERKFQEIFLTYWLNRVVPKPRILEVYLNMIEWGKGINGLADAAKYYFNKKPHELTLAESVWISSISPAPLRRENQRQTGVPPWFREVVDYTIRGMGKRGRLSEAEVAQGLRQPIRFANQSGEGAAAGDVAALSAEELAAEGLVPDPAGEGEGGGEIVPEAEGSGTPVPLTEQEIKDAAAAARTAKFLADSPAARLSGMGASARAPRGAGARPVAAPPKRRR